LDGVPESEAGSGFQGRVQHILKSYGRLYYLLIKIFSPVFVNPVSQKKIRKVLEACDEKSIILNLGSGPNHFFNRKDIINVDLFAFKEVDMVADVAALPVEDESVDLIINVAMLEHVADPKRVVREMYRILRKGGKIICYLPFMVPFHAAPNDFQRWTAAGIRDLFSSFQHLDVSIGCGPTSGMLWVFQEWLSILFSFGSRTVHDLFFLALMMFTAPVKLLDVLMVKFPCSDRIASGFYVIAEKGCPSLGLRGGS
jgi:SAM-dependent methyltransferase